MNLIENVCGMTLNKLCGDGKTCFAKGEQQESIMKARDDLEKDYLEIIKNVSNVNFLIFRSRMQCLRAAMKSSKSPE